MITKYLALVVVGAALALSGCVSVEDKPARSETTTTTEETTVHTPAVTETRTIRSY